MPNVPTREELISSARALARKLGRPGVSVKAWRKASDISKHTPIRLFGSWNAFIAAAGLAPDVSRRRFADDDLLRRVRDCCLAAGGVVTQDHVRRKAGLHASVFRKRWAGWRHVLVALRAWCAVHDPAFPYLAALPEDAEGPRARALNLSSGSERRYGAPLAFRGLLHAPVNETGVVLLFGMLAHELGFAVEHVAGGFPDCEAKRRHGDVWQRVRLEFEFESRNFKLHTHDPDGCDLIVCWAHNWPDCPLEVIELREEVAKRV